MEISRGNSGNKNGKREEGGKKGAIIERNLAEEGMTKAPGKGTSQTKFQKS